MKAAPFYFTASQLAAVLGVSRRRAHQYMVSVPSSPAEVRGVKAFCWPVGSIPVPLYQELQSTARRKGYCGVMDLLASRPDPWQPKHPVEMLARSAMLKAHARRCVLAPIFKMPDALLVSVAELVSRAMPGFRSSVTEHDVSERSVRRWIENAVERDRANLGSGY